LSARRLLGDDEFISHTSSKQQFFKKALECKDKMDELVSSVRKVIESVGSYQLSEQDRLSRDDVEMKGYRDPVTKVDRESELMLEEGFKEVLPEAGFRGEEREWSLWDGKCWVVDPLDGTKAYVAQRPGWGISVALFEKKEVVAGFLYLPQEKAFYHALKGQGAFKNGEPISVDGRKQDFVVSSFFKDLSLSKTVHDGAAWKCAKVAEGRFGAYLHWAVNGKGVKIWDVAAGALLVSEAGGFAGDVEGKPFDFFSEQTLVESAFISNGSETLINEVQTLWPGL